MILTDREIKIAIVNGLISVEPNPDEKQYSSSSLDLTLDREARVFKDPPRGYSVVINPNAIEDIKRVLDESTEPISIGDSYEIPPGRLVLAWTRENINLNLRARIAARVEGKSSLARFGLGIHITAPTIHAGFSGTIQLELMNHGCLPITLKPGMRICQLIFEQTLGTPEKGYQGQFLGQAPSH